MRKPNYPRAPDVTLSLLAYELQTANQRQRNVVEVGCGFWEQPICYKLQRVFKQTNKKENVFKFQHNNFLDSF